MPIADLRKNYSQEISGTIDYYPVAHRDSEINAQQNGNLELHEVSKIEDRVQCQIFLRYQRPGKTCCTWWSVCYKALPKRSRSK